MKVLTAITKSIFSLRPCVLAINTWLPATDYEPGHWLHFERLGAKTKNNGPESEEEIREPVKPKVRLASVR